MQKKMIDIVITGSDRTTFTGDVCNKIGTYLKALSAFDNKIPFYVALPSSTIDWSTKAGNEIEIEERNENEIHYVRGINEKNKIKEFRITPYETKASNYAFDVTPNKYISGLITEYGIFKSNMKDILKMKDKHIE